MDAELELEFRAFVEARAAVLFRSALALTGHRQQAEDLLQTILARGAQHWSRIRENNRPSGQVRWFDLDPHFVYHEMANAWSPDGTRLLLTKWPKAANGAPTGAPSMVLVDPDTLRVAEVHLAGASDIVTALTWRPDGQHVASAVPARTTKRAASASGTSADTWSAPFRPRV